MVRKAIQESQTSQLVAIGSRSITTAENFSKKFSIPKIYDNYQNLLNDKDIDATIAVVSTADDSFRNMVATSKH